MIKALPEEGSRSKGNSEEEGLDIVELLKKTAEKKKCRCERMRGEIFKLVTAGNMEC